MNQLSNITFDDTLIVAPTFHIYEKYCDALIELINENWPDHPELYFLSDSVSDIEINYKKIIRSEKSQWPFVVLNGCLEIKRKFPLIKQILLLNEEAFPLYKIDTLKLREVLSVSIKNNLSYVYFPCYDNNWDYLKTIDALQFCSTPKDYKYYTQLGPAFWNIDYLIKTCSDAIDENILSPWKFETIVTDTEHLISDYRWPTVADGLFKDGFVNSNALKTISNKKLKIRRQLTFEFIKTRPERTYRWILRRGIGVTNRILKLFKINPIPYPYRS